MLELVYTSRAARPAWAEVSDRDLLLAVRDGDEAALNELIGRKTKPLLQLTQRILGDLEEARDVVQVTFFKVWENRRKFDDRWSPNTWIYRIASNLAIDHLRSRRSREKSNEPVRQHLRQVADSRGAARPLAPAAGGGGGDLPRAGRPGCPRSSGWSSCCARSRGSRPRRWPRSSAAASRRCATTCSTPGSSCAASCCAAIPSTPAGSRPTAAELEEARP